MDSGLDRGQVDRMLAGQTFSCSDPMLSELRRQAKVRCKAYNSSEDGNRQLRSEMLCGTMTVFFLTCYLIPELLGGVGVNVEIEPPFYIDHGKFFMVGGCTILRSSCIVR